MRVLAERLIAYLRRSELFDFKPSSFAEKLHSPRFSASIQLHNHFKLEFSLRTDLTPIDLTSLVSSIASGVLAIVALALSIVFFILAKRDADRSSENASQIAGSVDRLEKLFDTLYSDTFSMMRDTYTDMRKHVWRAAPAKNDDDAEETASNGDAGAGLMLEKIAEVSAQVGVTGEKLEEFQARLQPVLAGALAAEEEKREAKKPSTRDRIIRTVRMRQNSSKPATLARLSEMIGVDEGDLVTEIFELGRIGHLDWNGAPSTLSQDAALHYVPLAARSAVRLRIARAEAEAEAEAEADNNG
ncbi:hypothetical protein [Salinibacterium sp. PAMC 21357]|uniref:hypothetical protein n=1 Tax=Salinibacterium sp. PAMC 21357 TaxID=1112215 RepID=UPI000288CCBC|nr:hypothetical protein [Salinibacterium sp. PAMC 21357]